MQSNGNQLAPWSCLRRVFLPSFLVSLLLSQACGGESTDNGPSSAGDGDGDTPSGTGGEGSPGTGGGGNPPDEVRLWPMPHPPGSGPPHPASYDTSVAGVVLDNVTGLMWQRQGSSRDESYLELGVSGEVVSARAQAHCSGLSLGGYDDWRLPSFIELVSLIDFERAAPAIDEAAFVEDWNASGSSTFLSLTPGPREQQRWAIDFDSGESRGLGQRVRCVRSDATEPDSSDRFVIGSSESRGTVADTWTGLVWQQSPSAEQFTFEEAQAECSDLDLAGGGFRAPSMKELLTIVDETKQQEPAMDTSVFDMPVDGGLFWTSSRNAAAPDSNAWYVVFGFGEVHATSPPPPTNLSNEYYVRCVK